MYLLIVINLYISEIVILIILTNQRGATTPLYFSP